MVLTFESVNQIFKCDNSYCLTILTSVAPLMRFTKFPNKFMASLSSFDLGFLGSNINFYY